jgi:8-oxo-dGTP diphosphatase
VASENAPLYERDAAAYQAHLAEGNQTQPRKRVAADVLFRDPAGRIMLVDPIYKPDWDLPGGMAEANEPPREAAMREIREELGFEPLVGQLLVVDWVPPHGPWDDLLVFVFDGGLLDEPRQPAIALDPDELRACRFCEPNEAAELLRPEVWRRAAHAINAVGGGHTLYLHSGEIPNTGD